MYVPLFSTVGVSVCIRQVPVEARSPGSPGAVGTGSCEPADMGAGNETQVLCKSSKYTQPLGHLSALLLYFLV